MRHFSGEFTGIRTLMLDELDLIAGGDGEDTDEATGAELNEIVVKQVDGIKTYANNLTLTNFADWLSWAGRAGLGDGNVSTNDAESIEVNVNITRALTATEQAAVDHLNQSIQKVTDAIAKIADNAKITLSNGSTVTGAELKQIWQNTDFVINENENYANQSGRGEANASTQTVSFNIQTLVDYNANAAGTDYLALHELAHMTSAGVASNNSVWADGVLTAAENTANETLANDIAKAIGTQGGITMLTGDTITYSSTTYTFN